MAPKVKAKKAEQSQPARAIRRGRKSTSTISSKNQVTLPVDILRASGLKPGETVSFEILDGKILMTHNEDSTHPFAESIRVAGSIYEKFDLKKERSQMWPE